MAPLLAVMCIVKHHQATTPSPQPSSEGTLQRSLNHSDATTLNGIWALLAADLSPAQIVEDNGDFDIGPMDFRSGLSEFDVVAPPRPRPR